MQDDGAMTNEVMVSVGDTRFEWREWDARPLGAETEWTHPGLAVLEGGDVAVFDQTRRELVRLDGNGNEVGRAAIEAACAHGLTASGADVWVADTGVRVRVVEGEIISDEIPGSVFRVSAAGEPTMALATPPHTAYRDGSYVPTSVVVADGAHGGSGDIWVADGYGQSLVHRFSSSGEHLAWLDGTEGGGRFEGAHSVTIDTRRSEPRLLVTDRSNHRVASYDLDGGFIGYLGLGQLRMPSAFTVAGDLLFIVELWSRIAAYDPDDRLLGYLGDGEVAWEEEAWPNRMGERGVTRRPVIPGRLNAPHGIDAGPDGTLYVAEWSLGGRIVELAPRPLII
jgi:hypothetical protein